MMTPGNKPTRQGVARVQHGLPTAALDYDLPERLIATRPIEPRDAARLLVFRRSADSVEHRHVRDLPELLGAGDVLLFNTSAVTPARLVGERADTGGRVEGLFLEWRSAGVWLVMLRSNGRLRAGQRIVLHTHRGEPSGHALELIDRAEENWLVRPRSDSNAHDILHEVGRTPLPPYISKARGEATFDDELDRRWYQTVFADRDQEQSVAAPTAGLHFTPELLAALERRGVKRTNVVLHVGPGTFKPIAAETLDQHRMHTERYEVPPETLRVLHEREHSGDNSDRARLVVVGTTTVRTLESLPNPLPCPEDGSYLNETDLLIAPPYHFRFVDVLLTNFHLPRSTLLALVGAMTGLERLKSIYAEAIEREYRFYSYGDAMLILP